MCYSAQLRADHATYIRFGGRLSLKDFAELYGHRVVEVGAKIPKALDRWFADDASIAPLIDQYNGDRLVEWQAELDKQGARLTEANQALERKPTKKAENDQRIAAKKIRQLRRWIEDAQRVEASPDDGRIFPAWYAPVIVLEDGKRVIKPMRYQCRPAGKPANYDSKYPGCYNARRDNLEGFWRGQFGHTHGLMLASAFYENVSRHRLEGRELADGEAEENVRIKFEPAGMDLMIVACLWSRWVGDDGEELLSFAAITDEPPPEVAAAGHDRCIIPIKPENVDVWLNPQGDLEKAYSILDDRERPYYEHRLAA